MNLLEVVLKNPIKKYIDKKNENLTPEEKQKREEMAQILTKELEVLINKKEDKVLYRYNKDFSRFRIEKYKFIVLLICEIILYLILGLFNTELSQKVIVTLPFICMTIPVFVFIFKIYQVVSMVEVMSGKLYNVITVKFNKHTKFMLFFGVLMLFNEVVLLCANNKELNVMQEVIYLIFTLIICIVSFVLLLHIKKFKKNLIKY